MDIALALGGGGIRGLAHIGVIDRLECCGFRIRAIAGTSAGGLVGAAYAAGNTPLEILSAIHKIDMATMYKRHSADGPSLLGHAGLVETLRTLIGERTFADLVIPFACTAVDLTTSREVYLREGKVLDAAMATMAIPGVLPPMGSGDALLVDGAVLDPVPVGLARLLAPDLPIIAVALSPSAEDWSEIPKVNVIQMSPLPFQVPASILQGFSKIRIGQALRIFSQSLEISSMMMTELRLKIDRPDVIIRPEVSGIGMFDHVDPIALVEIGRKSVDLQLNQIRREVSWIGNVDRLFRHISPIGEPMVLRDGHLVDEQTEKTP